MTGTVVKHTYSRLLPQPYNPGANSVIRAKNTIEDLLLIQITQSGFPKHSFPSLDKQHHVKTLKTNHFKPPDISRTALDVHFQFSHINRIYAQIQSLVRKVPSLFALSQAVNTNKCVVNSQAKKLKLFLFTWSL